MNTAVRQSWRDVRDYMRDQILKSEFRPGEKLPRDEDIARQLDCARSTVHRAMQSLADDGLIERRRKGGTIVNPNPITRTKLDIPISRLEIEQRGHAYRHHLIDTKQTKAKAPFSARLGVQDGHPLLRIRALHLADGHPYIFENRWVSLKTTSEILDVDFSQISANEWLVRNRPYSRCDVQIFAAETTAEEAVFMETKAQTASLVLERTTWIDNDLITHVRAVHAEGYRLCTS